MSHQRGCKCIWSSSRMSCNIRERGISYCLVRSRTDHRTSLEDDFISLRLLDTSQNVFSFRSVKKSNNTVIAHRSRWHISRSNKYTFATSMQWMDKLYKSDTKRMDNRPDSVYMCYIFFSCKHGENCKSI